MATSLRDPSVTDALLQARTARSKTVNGVTITTPFASPPDWRDQWIYFLMIDRFNNPGGAPKHMPYDAKFGGLTLMKFWFSGCVWSLP